MINKKRYVLRFCVALYPVFELQDKCFYFSNLKEAKELFDSLDLEIETKNVGDFYCALKLFEIFGEDETLIKEILYL